MKICRFNIKLFSLILIVLSFQSGYSQTPKQHTIEIKNSSNNRFLWIDHLFWCTFFEVVKESGNIKIVNIKYDIQHLSNNLLNSNTIKQIATTDDPTLILTITFSLNKSSNYLELIIDSENRKGYKEFKQIKNAIPLPPLKDINIYEQYKNIYDLFSTIIEIQKSILSIVVKLDPKIEEKLNK